MVMFSTSWRLRTLSTGLVSGVLVLILTDGAAATVTRRGDTEAARPWLDNPRISESAGSRGAGWFAGWTANSRDQRNHTNAVLFEMDSTTRWRLNRSGTQGTFGNFSGDEVVYSERRPGRPADLYHGDIWEDSHLRFPAVVNSAASEFHPTLSGGRLLFTRYTAGEDRYEVLLFDRRTRSLRTLATARGDAAVFAGQVRGDYATWYSWHRERSNVFVYRISRQETERIPRPAAFTRQHSSSVGADGTVYYQRRQGRGCGDGAQLVSNPPDGPPQVIHEYAAGTDGRRTVLDPSGQGPYLNFTVLHCNAPATRATDVYRIRVR